MTTPLRGRLVSYTPIPLKFCDSEMLCVEKFQMWVGS